MNRREFLRQTAGGAIGAWAAMERMAFAETAGAAKRPNVVVILADDLGYADLGVQGCTDIPTPHIDSIAKNGVRFTQGYVSCPVCSPTRAGFLTGRYQQRFGHEFNPGNEQQSDPKFGLPLTETTIADRFHAIGYATGMIGKSHQGYKPEFNPTKRGFDEYYGFLAGARTYWPVADGSGSPMMRGTEKVAEDFEYTTEAFAKEAVSFIERNKEKPFFLYSPFNAVHAPMQALQKYLDRFASIKDQQRRTFAAMLSALDDAVGTILEALDKNGLRENTLVFFFSDNGGPTPHNTSRNDPLRGFKATVYEGGVRVPFLAQWPGQLPAGAVYENPVIALDILPTALSAAGAAIDPAWKLDGVNLLPCLKGEKKERPHETLYWRFGKQHAIRHGDWKLLVAPDSETPQLYNLANDAGEKKNLYETEKEKSSELTKLYEAWNAQLMPPRWQPGNAALQRARKAARAAK